MAHEPDLDGGVIYAMEFPGLTKIAYIGLAKRYKTRQANHLTRFRNGKHYPNLQEIYDADPNPTFRILEVVAPSESLEFYLFAQVKKEKPLFHKQFTEESLDKITDYLRAKAGVVYACGNPDCEECGEE